jgi:hypothetical protein
MTVRELIEELQSLPPGMQVEVESYDRDVYDTRNATGVRVESVTRGIALPQPRTYDIAVVTT